MKRFILTVSALLCVGAFIAQAKSFVLENSRMKLSINENGYAESLICKESGKECLAKGAKLPLCSIKQNRPYDNENFLMFPAKPISFPSNKISFEKDTLRVEFQDTYDIAVISVNIQKDYISFKLERVDYRIEDFGVKRKTEIDNLGLLQLPVLEREHFGDWLNVTWDEKTAVALIATIPETRIDSYKDSNKWRRMYAGAEQNVLLEGVEAALIVAGGKEPMLDCIDTIEKDFRMPRGVQSRRCEQYKYSYYEVRGVTPQNVNKHIEYAKMGGFRQMVIYYPDFAYTCGHFCFNSKYPNGIEDLKKVVDEMKHAGMVVGLHTHYCKVSTDDPYVAGGTPDHRLNYVGDYTLKSKVGVNDTVFLTENRTNNARKENGRRILMIDDEFISYESASEQEPYGFYGCKRGLYGTKPAEHSKDAICRQPDFDDWPRFIRIDQNSEIQDEIAANIARIYDSCGFNFLYFDGAEDVPEPYWYNVSRSQYKIWDALESPMIFAEGALKSHYGWHILSRGNAFDHFKEDKVKEAMQKYNIRAAKAISNDFTSVNFGWLYCDMKPETYEYICKEAARYNCPISYIAELDKMDACPYIIQILTTIKQFEDNK